MTKIKILITQFWPAFIAIVLWLAFTDQTETFSNTSAVLRTIGQVAALTGASLYAWNFILASRLRIIEELFFGLNKVYTSHHQIGAVSFILLLFHPTFLALQYLPFGIEAVADFLIPTIEGYPMLLGTIALDITIIALVITFFTKIKYHLWKLSHQMLGIALMFASLHIVLVPSILGDNLPLRIFFYILFATAVILFTTRTVLSNFFVKRYEYTVIGIKEKGLGIREITMQPKDDRMKFKPGQFLFIKFYNQNIKREFHPFSFTGNAADDSISIAVKELGDFTKQLAALKPSDRAILEGPYGKFNFDIVSNKKQIWIAGGIGITPFLSGIRSLPENHQYDIHFYYSAKTKAEAVYLDELNQIAVEKKAIKIIPFLQDVDGFISIKAISEKTSDLLDRDIFLCGPPIMMKSLRKQAHDSKIPDEKIHSEEFALYEGK